VKRAAIAGAVAALILSAPVFADELADGLAALPGAVEDVRIGGTWEKDGKSGAYRIVIAREGSDTITARLFIQWIAYDDAGGAKLEETVEIKEFADLKLDIVDYTSDSDTDGLSVYLETVNPESDADESYELFVFSPTDYRLGPATN
jgi:hypothetical protein